MKKLISVLLALVMAMSLCAVAWADGEPTFANGVWTGVTPANLQELLDGQYGSIDNTTIVLSAGDYSKVDLGKPTVIGTQYTCPHNDPTDNTGLVTFDTVQGYINHMTQNAHHGDRRTFTRTISNVTITAQENANVAGLTMISRMQSGEQDPFVTSVAAYYNTILIVNNLKFTNIHFTGKVEIAAEKVEQTSETTAIDGVTFENCSFETGNTTGIDGQAINYSNALSNGKVKNLTIKNCEFKNCYQGVYTNGIVNISVTNSTFDTTGHNAISVQDAGVCDHGTVIVTGNTFQNVHDRVFRFNNAGGDTRITINNNVMVNCGDDEGQLFKTTSLEDTVSADLNNNYWDGKTAETAVANEGIRPTKIGVTEGTFSVRLTSDMLADGMAARDNGDGTYTVVTEQPAPTPEPPTPVEPEQPAHTNRRYPATTTTTETPAKGNDVTSAKTFDGGVALYVGMALTSTLGMAWMGKKRAQ